MKSYRPVVSTFLSTAVLAALVACSGGDHRDEQAEHRAVLAANLDATAVATFAQNPTWPGVAGHVIVDSVGLTWRTGLGFADVETRRPLKADATFRTASITKTFTAASIYRLAEMNHLDVADPIERHLQPASSALLRTAGYDQARITIDHLLAHSSGLRDYAVAPEFFAAVLADPARTWSRMDQVAFAMSLGGPHAAPGEGFVYSDTGYILLGEMIESKTGLALGAAYRTLLRLDALGLRATYQERIDPAPAGAGERAHQYIEQGVDGTAIDPSVDLWGGGGLVSDAHDLATFVRALLQGRVIGNASLERMKTVTFAQPGRAPARGLFRVAVGAHVCWGHDGFWGAVAIHCPKSGVTVAGTINTSPFGLTPGSEVDSFEFAAKLAATAIGS
jgi:D-alanyl-D-alanine carboxypeptidase